MERIVIAMSGGVDSSVAAYLLKEQGYEVIGITMYIKESEEDKFSVKKCCSISDIMQAKEVAKKLDIPHYVLDLKEEFSKNVIDYFISDYKNGRTPNPCIMCNTKIKFGELLRHAKKIEASKIATGHYALTRYDKKTDRYLLLKAAHADKDQSYFLFNLKQSQLKHMLFPLGNLDKKEVKKIAQKFDMDFEHKKESQDVCFVPENDYRLLLKKYLPEQEGDFILEDTGEVIGKHNGYFLFTVGQRRNLGVAVGERLYVTRIDPKENRVFLAYRKGMLRSSFDVQNTNFIYYKRPPKTFECEAQVRFNGELIHSQVQTQEKDASVILDTPAFAVAPGQAAVFYKGNIVLGGGFIK